MDSSYPGQVCQFIGIRTDSTCNCSYPNRHGWGSDRSHWCSRYWTRSTTAVAQVVSEVLALPLDMIHVRSHESDTSPVDLGSYSSRVTFMNCNAAIRAAMEIPRTIAKRCLGNDWLPSNNPCPKRQKNLLQARPSNRSFIS